MSEITEKQYIFNEQIKDYISNALLDMENHLCEIIDENSNTWKGNYKLIGATLIMKWFKSTLEIIDDKRTN